MARVGEPRACWGATRLGSCGEQCNPLPCGLGKRRRGRLSPLTQGLAHAEAHPLQDQQACLLSLEDQGREARGRSTTSFRGATWGGSCKGPSCLSRSALQGQGGLRLAEGQPGFAPLQTLLPHRASSPLLQKKWGYSPHSALPASQLFPESTRPCKHSSLITQKLKVTCPRAPVAARHGPGLASRGLQESQNICQEPRGGHTGWGGSCSLECWGKAVQPSGTVEGRPGSPSGRGRGREGNSTAGEPICHFHLG